MGDHIIMRLKGLVACLLLTGLLNHICQAQPEFRIWLELEPQSKHFGHVMLEGLDPFLLSQLQSPELDGESWTAIFPIYPGKRTAPPSSLPSMLGNYQVKEDMVIFIPCFPFLEGTVYTAWLNLPLLHSFIDPHSDPARFKVINQIFEVPQITNLPPAIVERIFPSGDTLPENLLKIYLHFSHPMREGVALEHVHLLNDEGETVEAPFLVMDQELWDSNRKRLTLWFDPGRIKRHLVPHHKKGMLLQAGARYTLVVDSAWEDAYGRRLADGYMKPFVATKADRSSPKPNLWKLELPAHNSHEGLVINFPEPLDHALLQRSLQVLDSQGELIEGTASISQGEQLWELIPEEAWQAGEYMIRIHTRLEDLAGNNLNRLFDSEFKGETHPGSRKSHHFLKFSILNP